MKSEIRRPKPEGRPNPKSAIRRSKFMPDERFGFMHLGNTPLDLAYEEAEKATGIKAYALREYAVRVFGSVLIHAMEAGGETSWTQTRIRNGKLDLEVDAPPRRIAKEARP